MTGLEAAIGARYTFDTVAYLKAHCPGVDFVWIMGADNLRSFHRWENWRGIASMVPIAVVDRLGPSLYAAGGTAAQALARFRIPERAARSLAGRKPPAWVYLHGLKSPLSSTALRAARGCRKTAVENGQNTCASEVQVVETINRPCLSLKVRRNSAR